MHLNIMLYIQCPSCSTAFTRKLHEVTIFASSCLSVHLPNYLHETQQLSPDSACYILYLEYLLKSVNTFQHWFKVTDSKWTPTYICNISSCQTSQFRETIFFVMNMLQPNKQSAKQMLALGYTHIHTIPHTYFCETEPTECVTQNTKRHIYITLGFFLKM